MSNLLVFRLASRFLRRLVLAPRIRAASISRLSLSSRVVAFCLLSPSRTTLQIFGAARVNQHAMIALSPSSHSTSRSRSIFEYDPLARFSQKTLYAREELLDAEKRGV